MNNVRHLTRETIKEGDCNGRVFCCGFKLLGSFMKVITRLTAVKSSDCILDK